MMISWKDKLSSAKLAKCFSSFCSLKWGQSIRHVPLFCSLTSLILLGILGASARSSVMMFLGWAWRTFKTNGGGGGAWQAHLGDAKGLFY